MERLQLQANGRTLVAVANSDSVYPNIKLLLCNEGEEMLVGFLEYNPDRGGFYVASYTKESDAPASYTKCD